MLLNRETETKLQWSFLLKYSFTQRDDDFLSVGWQKCIRTQVYIFRLFVLLFNCISTFLGYLTLFPSF